MTAPKRPKIKSISGTHEATIRRTVRRFCEMSSTSVERIGTAVEATGQMHWGDR